MAERETETFDWQAAVRRVEARMRERPNPIPSYYEGWALRQRDADGADAARSQLARHERGFAQGRFVPWAQRRAVPRDGLDPNRLSEIPDMTLIMSQGIDGVLRWRGRELFKNVFDFALIPMLLAELRPATILEIGSGNGASAAWLADLAALAGAACVVYSVDIAPVELDHPGVHFIRADSRDLGAALPPDWAASGPRLVIEDAHIGVGEVLDYVDRFLVPGDYLIIEDSVRKAELIDAFISPRCGSYRVDTRYTDFFGRNATSCIDSILKRVA